MNMNELYDAFTEKKAELKVLEDKIEKHERSIERLKAKYYKTCDSLSWVKCLVYPLAEELKNLVGAEKYDVYGPFGLRAETSIYLRKGKMSGSITLTPHDNFRLYYDTGEKRGQYEARSLGALNGMDNVEAPLPDDVSEIAALLHWFEEAVNT